MKSLLKHLLLILLLLPLRGIAQPCINDSALIPVDSTVRIGHLENGLTYYIKYNNWPENRASFYLAQRVGSLQEEDNQRGLAHFLEHMCFNGSEHFPGNRVDSFFERRNWGRFRLIHFLRHQKCTLAATKVETAPTDAKTVPMDNKTAPTDDKTAAMFGKNRRLLIPPAINVNRSR